jgi:hypothetical protein
MQFRISDTFTDSLTRLTADEQKAVKITAFDLQQNPVNPGLKFHRIEKSKDLVQTEEATKNAFIMPFIAALGYDVFDPTEVTPELVADVGTKKGEKIDYAILKDSKPIMLFECKHHGANLDGEHANQLYRYFACVETRVAVLTNGIEYRFATVRIFPYSAEWVRVFVASQEFVVYSITQDNVFRNSGTQVFQRFMFLNQVLLAAVLRGPFATEIKTGLVVVGSNGEPGKLLVPSDGWAGCSVKGKTGGQAVF